MSPFQPVVHSYFAFENRILDTCKTFFKKIPVQVNVAFKYQIKCLNLFFVDDLKELQEISGVAYMFCQSHKTIFFWQLPISKSIVDLSCFMYFKMVGTQFYDNFYFNHKSSKFFLSYCDFFFKCFEDTLGNLLKEK